MDPQEQHEELLEKQDQLAKSQEAAEEKHEELLKKRNQLTKSQEIAKEHYKALLASIAQQIRWVEADIKDAEEELQEAGDPVPVDSLEKAHWY